MARQQSWNTQGCYSVTSVTSQNSIDNHSSLLASIFHQNSPYKQETMVRFPSPAPLIKSSVKEQLTEIASLKT